MEIELDRPPDGFRVVRSGRMCAWVRSGYEAHLEALGLGGEDGRRPGALGQEGGSGEGPSDAASIERVGGGRAAHPLVTLPSGERVLVRRYMRGGAMRHINRARYFAGHRSFEELAVTVRAAAAGIRVPHVIAAAERRRLIGYHAWIATRWIPNAVDLGGWLAERRDDGASAADVARAVGFEIGKMHRAGIAHLDLNLRNVLVDDAGTVHLLDFDKARAFDRPIPPALRITAIDRFRRSAQKLGVALGEDGWAALAEGYGDGWESEL